MEFDEINSIAKVKAVADEMVKLSLEKKYGSNFDDYPKVIIKNVLEIGVDLEALAIELPKGWRVDILRMSVVNQKMIAAGLQPIEDSETTYARLFPPKYATTQSD